MGDEPMQRRLAQTLTASEGVAKHSISNEGREDARETRPQPQQQLAPPASHAFESVKQHSISNQGSETMGETQTPLQQQSGRPATTPRKRNGRPISDVESTAKKRETDKAYRERKKAETLKIKSDLEKLAPENEQLKLEKGQMKSEIETLTDQIENMKVEIKEKNQIIQKKDQQMKSLKAENEQLNFQILKERNQTMEAKMEKLEAEKKLLECQNNLLQRDLATSNQSSQTQSIELPQLPYDDGFNGAWIRIWSQRGKVELSYPLSSLQGRETFLRRNFKPRRDGCDFDILMKDSAGNIWEFRCCSVRITSKRVIFGGWVFSVSNQMSSKQRSGCFL